MSKSKITIKKLVVGLIGFPVLALGIVMVPLPGPGVLISLLAFFILSQEFAWAEKGLFETKQVISKIYESAKKQAAKIDPDLQ